MVASPSSALRGVRAPGYLILGLAALIPIADYLTTLWPLIPGKLAWRFGAMGLASSSLAVPLLMLLLIFALALMMGDRRVTQTVGILAAGLAVFLLGGLVLFILDAVQMRGSIGASAMARFQTASLQAIVKLLLHGISSVVLSVAAFRAARSAKHAAVRSAGRGNPLLVSSAGGSWVGTASSTPKGEHISVEGERVQ